jgi:polysaccharide export outer membrane protein
VLVFLAVASTACGGGGPQPDTSSVARGDPTSDPYPLAPGDEIRVSFSEEVELNGQFPIDETGTVSLPLLGSVKATDLPAPALKEDLLREYQSRTRNQAVQVVYLRRVRVLGEVRAPGLYFVDPTMTFDDAIALAGGATEVGNLENVRLVRGGQEVVEGLDVSMSIPAAIQSGDQIFVPKISWFSRYGAVLIGAGISALGVILAFAN